jgi:hypothetical protein
MRFLPLALIHTTCLPSPAATIPVTTSDDVVDAGDGLTSLREAVADADAGDEVVFDFPLDGATITTAITLVIDKDLTISADSLPAGLRLDAQLNHRLLDIPAGVTVTIESVSLLNGRTTNQNGGPPDGIVTFTFSTPRSIFDRRFLRFEAYLGRPQ